MINLHVRGESGTIEARAKHGVLWGPELAGLDQAVFPMLGHLLPYGDTVFNHRQVSTLLEEVPRLPAGVLTDEFARELIELGQVVLAGQGLYLWFLGD
ncbi:hypothetical protein [Streptomyces sp. TN58]|uniref:hypothetical protein n=1 Tax=Streptomyces sp. TN58 TaxID=234612 RepID=UPI0009505451|nr:hypothetical protein [Streptomyces sp. TN58]APU38437.1 hypothetical protein BSL84_00155 [Streptomyces sp. TN58]APU44030.1 hypothetical protein BSL84_34350 [Streptomyces sp. TN58]